jgi:hypothetical protein
MSKEGSSRSEVKRQLPIPRRAMWPREARAGKYDVLNEANSTMRGKSMICSQNFGPSLTKPILSYNL